MHEAPLGALRPIAAHKGGGLIAAVELLAGLLSGGGTLQPGNARDGGIVNNMTAIVIDPEAVSDLDWLRSEYDAMAAYIRSSPPPPGQPPLQLPGEPERLRRGQRQADGVEISDAEWAAIIAAARTAGVLDTDQWPQPQNG